jgi:hypothetical protein
MFMDKRNKLIVSFMFLVFLVIGLYYFSDWFSKTTGYLIEDEEAEADLAKCLTKQNVVLYGAAKCVDCKKQIDLFGNGFKFVNYVECNGHSGVCQDLSGVPSWHIGENFVYGVKSLSELRILANCEI